MKSKTFSSTESFRYPRSEADKLPADEDEPSTKLPPLHPTHVPYRRAASYILTKLQSTGDIPSPVVGIVCGSGLSNLSQALDPTSPKITIPYSTIPGFPNTSVAGHAGELVVGTLHSIPTICFRGRFHSYEGHDMPTVVLPVQVMRCLGVRLVLVTNAAGGLKAEYAVGDVAVIRDHIALPLLAGKNPLVGPNDDEMGPRFPPTSNLYDVELQEIVVRIAKELDFDKYLHCDGTYAFVSGPQYESKSECAMLNLLGAHAVGMSTVPEILAAHHSGMAVLCMSLITNKVVYFDSPNGDAGHANHEEVLAAVKGRSEQLVKLVAEVVRECGESYLPKLKELSPITLETEGRVLGEEGEEGMKTKSTCSSGFTLCPYHMVKNALSAPMHCVVMGGAILAMGAVFGMKIGNRT
mmetsp:Transcript_43894/g.92359  ORF Transcript_43894/g.92359 Transcript_43894/m.92359 type:complete len:409 (-) Transcript_43894:365-1591(-)|eukprot:CAMPEP_0183708888 /NCGR_PEP_ID=MMETSP0737-20130205/5059_1 /TAXON_ID=385413 /ORGANISM="Thalassiosira miniscula, Strain CCMP1093" /LENGTH=408 /DNA_ID=CAMNT_0025936843 /DNA_START=113 /DNA_END=1339 /DNA_ORIENTATION=+